MRSKKAFLNIVAMGLFEIASIICSMILPRLIIGKFGSDYNGVLTSVTQFLQLISILQAGIGGATRVALYRALADSDKSKINSVLRANQLYMRKIATVYMMYVVFMAAIYTFVAKTSVGWLEAAPLILIVGAGTFAQYFFGITYQTLLKADQRSYIYYVFQILATVSNAILSVILVNMNCSIHVVKLGSSVVFCVTPILLAMYVKKKYSLNLNVEPDNASLNEKKNVMLHTVADIFYENMPLVALTLFTSTMVVSVYTVYNTVLNGLRKMAMVFTGSLESGYGNMWAQKEYDTLRKRTLTYEYFINAFSSVIFSVALFLIIPFIRIYTKGITDIEYVRPEFAAIAIYASMVYCLRMPYTTLIQACGLYKETRLGIMCEIVINIVGAVALTNIWGISGPSIVLLLIGAVRTFYFAGYLYRNVLHMSMWQFAKRMLWTAFNITLSSVLLNLFIDEHVINTWLNWVIAGIVAVLISAVVMIANSFVCYRTEIINLINVFKRMIKR